jgi:flagellar motor protein MotB
MQLSMANFLDPGKVEAALESIHAAFSSGGRHRSKKVVKTQGHTSDKTQSSKQSMQSMVSELRDVLSQNIANSTIKMEQSRTEVRLKLDSKMLFEAGSSNLHPQAFGVITSITEALEGESIDVKVEGHADDDGSPEGKNWELSSLRAVSVVQQMRSKKGRDGLPIIKGEFITAQGMGHFRPADPNKGSSPWNRRVEIVIKGQGASAKKAAYKVRSSQD